MQRDRDAQRAAERAQHDDEPGLNMLGQSNMMASFTEGGGEGDGLEGDGLDFQIDEYGGGMG